MKETQHSADYGRILQCYIDLLLVKQRMFPTHSVRRRAERSQNVNSINKDNPDRLVTETNQI